MRVYSASLNQRTVPEMNERQHDTLREMKSAQWRVEQVEADLMQAKKTLRRAKIAHFHAINADLASWNNTPGVEKVITP